MFTGIVEELGAFAGSEPGPDSAALGSRLIFNAERVTEGSRVGDSISVNGCCLTVIAMGPGWWAADAVPETLSRTSLGSLRSGDPVNFERAVSVGSRLGGHLVQGHVDAVGRITQVGSDLRVAAPDSVRRYLVEKGSVTVDGVSLTVVAVTEEGFDVAVIPHTLSVTTLGRKRVGDPVNLEADVIAKYAERLLQGGTHSPYTELGSIERS